MAAFLFLFSRYARAADVFFLVFHTFLIFFNLFGWIWRPLRRANLAVLILTGSSWFILGIFYGIGFCPLTDMHWKVLNELGQYNLPNSYISYLIFRFTGYLPDTGLVDTLTLVLYFLALAASVYMNFFRRKGHPADQG